MDPNLSLSNLRTRFNAQNYFRIATIKFLDAKKTENNKDVCNFCNYIGSNISHNLKVHFIL